MTPPRFTWRDDRGQVGGIEVIPFGLLIFVVGGLLVANAWAVIDAKMAVTSVAREAARSYVEAPDERTASERAVAAGRAAIVGHGRDAGRLRLEPDATDFARCGQVTFAASYPVPAITLPWIGGFGRSFTVRASHSELVDPYRSGLPGAASCD